MLRFNARRSIRYSTHAPELEPNANPAAPKRNVENPNWSAGNIAKIPTATEINTLK
jgi:hypothetical protein